MTFQIQDQEGNILLILIINKEVKSKDISNRLALISIKSFNINRLYEELGFEVKELCNINSTSRINKYKTIRFKVNKSNQGYIKSIL